MKFYTEKFRDIRKKKGYSVEELAKRLKVSRVTLWAWEKGKRVPPEKKIRQLAVYLNVQLNEFSDLPGSIESSKSDLGELFRNWNGFIDKDIEKRIGLKEDIISKITYMDKELNNALILVKTLINSMDSMFYIKDINLNYIMANKAFIQSFGEYRDTDFVYGRNDNDFFDNKFAIKNRKQDEEVLLTGAPVIKNEDFLPGSRKNKWILISKLPVFDNSNKIAGVIGVFIDITDRKKEEVLREVIETNVDVMSDGLAIFNLETNKFMFVNKATELIFGYKAEKFYQGGLDFLINQCIHPDHKDIYDNIDPDYIKSKKKFEIKIIKPNNEIRWIEARRSIVEYMGNKSNISIIRDITEHKSLEQENQFFLNVMDNFNDVVWISELDQDNMPVFRYLNSEIENLTGYKKEDFLTKKIVFRDIVLPEYREELDFWLSNKVSPGIFECKLRCADNTEKWVNSKISKTVDNNEKPIFFGLLRDITERKRIEESRDSLDLMLNSALDIISAYDVESMSYLYINKIVEKIVGYPVEDFYKNGASFWLNTCIHPDDREQRALYHENRSWPEKSRYRIVRLDGEIRMLEVNVSNKKFPFHNRECIVSVARDVTDNIF